MTKEITLRDYIGATVLAAIVQVEENLNQDDRRSEDEAAKQAILYADAYLKAAGTQPQQQAAPPHRRRQGPPPPMNEEETPLNAEMWNLPKGTHPEADDIGMCVETNREPAKGTLVRFKTKGGKVRTVRTDQVLDTISNQNGKWYVCTVLMEQQQQDTAEVDAAANQGWDEDQHQGQTPGHWNENPDPSWLDNPPPGAGDGQPHGRQPQQDTRHQDVQRDVPAAPYKFDANYDGDHDGYGAKAFQEVEEGDWLLVKTDKGKRWPEIVTEVIRTTTLQGQKCWICATKKPPKKAGNGNGNGHQQQRQPGMWD